MGPVRYGLHTLLWMALTLGATGQSTPQSPGRENRNISPVEKTRPNQISIRGDDGGTFELYTGSYALVIGVSVYEKWRPLPGVRKDVEAVRDILTRQGFHVETLLEPTRPQFREKVDQFIAEYGTGAEAKRNRLLIYFAGHGATRDLPDGRSMGYIVMKDAPRPDEDPGLFVRSSMNMDEIKTDATRIEATHAIFVFDSCFAGTIFRKTEERRIPPAISQKSSQPVRQFITSGTANQEVPDESIFRRYFVRALEGEGDLNEDGYVTGEELGIYLNGKVYPESKATQTPTHGKIQDVNLNLGDVIFPVGKRSTPTASASPVTTPATLTLDPEEEAWKVVAPSKNPEVVREFLRLHPNGRYAGAAQLKLKDLETATTAAAEIRKPGIVLTRTAFTTGTMVNGKLSRSQGECEVYREDLGNGVALEMVKVPGGEFLMGEDEPGAADYEKECGRWWSEKEDCKMVAKWQTPRHRVKVEAFLMGKYEVTQRQWRAVMGGLPPEMEKLEEKFKGDDKPVVNVSWEEVKEFIKRLGKGYRLPSEAEWEYAARGGMRSAYGFGEEINPDLVNYAGNHPAGKTKKGLYRNGPVDVGELGLANRFGLYDMHGNVWEWCEDEFHESYNGAPVDGSAWVSSTEAANRVIRGGSWYNNAVNCRSAIRNWGTPGNRRDNLGFRLSRTLP